MWKREKKRAIRRGWIAAVAAVVALTGSMLGASAAVAAEYDYPAAIDPSSIVVTTTDGSGTVTVDERLRVEASWAVPDGARAGQTFGFTLPTEFSRWASSFAIPADDDPSRTVAECTVSKDDAAVVTCALTDYVAGRTKVSGSLWFFVSAAEQTSRASVDFIVNGTTTPVPIPGGGIVQPNPPPTAPAKWSWEMADGRIGWQLSIPGTSFAGVEAITIDDTLDPSGEGRAAHRNVDGSFIVWSTDLTGGDRQPVAGWSGKWDSTGTSFRLVIPGPIDTTRHFSVRYYTVPMAPALGAVYGNTADIEGTIVGDTQVWTASGGGTGAGGSTGTFSLAKVMTGDAATAVPDGTKFSVVYSYGDPVVTEALEVSVGEPAMSIPVPSGTVVTLEEIALPALDGVSWGRPVFSGSGVRVLDDGRAELTVAGGDVVDIALTNTAAPVAPPLPKEPWVPEKPGKPEVPGSPAVPKERPIGGDLASTGADAPGELLWAAGASVMLGLLLTGIAAARRRRASGE